MRAFSSRLDPGGGRGGTGSITGCNQLQSIAQSFLVALEWRGKPNHQAGVSGSFCSREICQCLMLAVRGLGQS